MSSGIIERIIHEALLNKHNNPSLSKLVAHPCTLDRLDLIFKDAGGVTIESTHQNKQVHRELVGLPILEDKHMEINQIIGLDALNGHLFAINLLAEARGEQ